MYVVFICFFGFCKHAIFREAYFEEYRRWTGEKNQGVVRCPSRPPEGLLEPGYYLYGDYCVPNSGRRGKYINSASGPVKPSFGRRLVAFDGF